MQIVDMKLLDEHLPKVRIFHMQFRGTEIVAMCRYNISKVLTTDKVHPAFLFELRKIM